MLHSISTDISIDERIFIQDTIEGEGLKYIARYAVHRFQTKYPYLGIPTCQLDTLYNPPDWIQLLLEGNLIYPSNAVIYTAKKINKIFQDFHGSFFSKEKWIFKC